MFVVSNLAEKILRKLTKKSYRHAYVAEHVRRGIAYQIRALREQRGWNQGRLASLMSKPQSVISRVEDPAYGKVTVQTLLEVASTFDVALQIRFVSYSTFLMQTRDLSTASMYVSSFEDESKLRSPILSRGDMLVVGTQRGRTIQFSTDTSDQDIAVISGAQLESSGASYVN